MKIEQSSDIRGWFAATDSELDRLLAAAAERAGISTDAVLAKLAAGARLIAIADSYSTTKLRDADAPRWSKARPAVAQRMIQCRSCGEHLSASRFTTLPATEQTCDDCA